VRNVERFRTDHQLPRRAVCRLLSGVGCRGVRSRGTAPPSGATKGHPRQIPASASRRARRFHVLSATLTRITKLRVSTPDDWRLRAIGGLFYETSWCRTSPTGCTKTTPNGIYGTASTRCQAPAAFPRPTTTTVRPDSVAFYDDVQRGFKAEARLHLDRLRAAAQKLTHRRAHATTE